MEFPKRLSLNTSLRNAKIFEDDSEDSNGSYISIEDLIKERNMKKEKQDNDTKIKIKEEKIDNGYNKACIKPEPSDSTQTEFKLVKPEQIKNELEDSCDIDLDRLGLKTPIKTEIDDGSPVKSNLKSAKRSLLRQRNSPYAKEVPRSEDEKKGKKRDYSLSLSEEGGEKKVRRKGESKKFESDPEVLTRRQKQIDFGKNTIGYDNYVMKVPKDKRTPEDPVTPNKYRMYSRRGFDGLIKQWRLKLHNYDP